MFDELGIADVELKVSTESDNEVGVFPVQRDYRIKAQSHNSVMQ